MRDFFDSSVLVAAFDDQDERHGKAWDVFYNHAEGGGVPIHSLGEIFSILTGRRGWTARDAFEIIRTNTEPMEKIGLNGEDYLRTLEVAEKLGIRGGAIYDGLILACARKFEATTIWTLNERHFILFGEELSERVRGL